MAKKKEDVVEVVEEAATEKQPEEKKKVVSSIDLKNSMLEVGLKLCDDILNGKARNEETALKAVVEIFEAVKGA